MAGSKMPVKKSSLHITTLHQGVFTQAVKPNILHLTTILQRTVILSAAPPQPVLIESQRRGVEEPRECLDLEYRSKAFYPDFSPTVFSLESSCGPRKTRCLLRQKNSVQNC